MTARDVVLLAYERTELLDVACVTSVLDFANRLSGRELYAVELVSPAGRAVHCDSGLTLSGVGTLELTTGPLDTLIVSGGLGHEHASGRPTVCAHVRRLASVARRVASTCTGATVLAAAGLLAGRRATTHWRYADDLARHFPDVHVDSEHLYLRDGPVLTSGGVTSALDLTLALVAEDHGTDLSRRIARGLVTHLHRPGSQSQTGPLTAPHPDHTVLRTVLTFVDEHLGEPLDAARLAAVGGVSTRHLHRLFAVHTGTSPGRYVRRARVDAAAQLLAATSMPHRGIASRTGFTSVETLRQAFTREYGVAPAAYRQRVGRG